MATREGEREARRGGTASRAMGGAGRDGGKKRGVSRATKLLQRGWGATLRARAREGRGVQGPKGAPKRNQRPPQATPTSPAKPPQATPNPSSRVDRLPGNRPEAFVMTCPETTV